jgi:DNA helicase-2/ATP-dependent DNA helicase PcrA
LPAIAALIDPRQFELISRPSSGVIVVQGTAGSGKTTIGLAPHRLLEFRRTRLFPPERHAGHRLPARAGGLRLAGFCPICK